MAPVAKRKRSSKVNGTGPQGKKLADTAPAGNDVFVFLPENLERGGDDNDEEEPKPPPKRRKRGSNTKPPKSSTAPSKQGKSTKRAAKEANQTKKDNVVRSSPTSKSTKEENADDANTEKRLRRFRAHPPSSYLTVAARALSQRLCVLERRRTGTEADPEETVEIAGTTGNIYTVRINRLPSCDCPHAEKGNQCKHVIYVMKRTLRAPEALVYQLALLSSEVAEIFANAPPLPTDKGDADAKAMVDEEDPNRKPVDDDCPICCVDFDAANDDIVWCKAGCGNNVHRGCFDTWANMKKTQGAKVTCPFCRTEWHDDKLTKSVSAANAAIGPEGYRNVAAQLGLSGLRDYSTYHQHWVRRQRWFGGGIIDDEDFY